MLKKWFKTFYRISTIDILHRLHDSYDYESLESHLRIT